MKMPSEHDIKVMHKMQEKLWELISSFPNEEDRIKIAGVTLKVTIQLYQSILDTDGVEKILHYAADNLKDIQSPFIPEQRVLH
tara:strand:+ start:1985 stop:2233 length:249 start_codon:yes stop_codon:yes gene_type:complete